MKLRLVTGTAVLLLAAALSPVAPAATAPASTPFLVVDALDVVLYDGCNRYPVHYQVDPGSPTHDWYLLPGFALPKAIFVEGVGPSTGITTMEMCPIDRPGSHQIDVQLRTRSGITRLATASDTFTARRPATRTPIGVSDRTPRPGQQVTVRLVTLAETPTGFVRDDTSVLQLQQKTRKGWKKVAKRRTDEGRARAGFRYRGGKVTLRGKSVGSSSDNDTGSFSVKITLGKVSFG